MGLPTLRQVINLPCTPTQLREWANILDQRWKESDNEEPPSWTLHGREVDVRFVIEEKHYLIPGRQRERMRVLGITKKTTSEMQGEFTSTDVMNKIIELNPELVEYLNRSSVTAALNRLVDAEKLVLTKRGAGKRPSSYKNIEKR